MNDRWETRFTFGDSGLPRRPLASVTVPVPAQHVHGVALTERIHRALNPEPPVDLFELGYRTPLATDFSKPAAVETAETEATAPVITPPERDLNGEVGELLESVFGYLNQFVVFEQPDNFDEGYRDPLSTSKPPQPEKSREAVEFETRKSTLLSELRTWSGSLIQFLTDHRSWRTAELRQQHAEAWAVARTQDAVVAGIVAEGQQAAAEMRRLKVEQAKARLLAEAHVEAEPDLNDLPSQQALDQWRVTDERLKAAWKAADEAVSAELSRQRSLRLRYEREVIKRRALRQVEHDLRVKLGGEDVKDLGTGLVGAPEV